MEFKEGKRYVYNGRGRFAFTKSFNGGYVIIDLDNSVILKYKNGRLWKDDLYFEVENWNNNWNKGVEFVEYLSESEKKRMADLEKEYSGYALQGILSNTEIVKNIDGNTYKKVASLAKRFASEMAKATMED